jgi:hypothetical protein
MPSFPSPTHPPPHTPPHPPTTTQAFSYYDTTLAVLNAHLPATSLYAGSGSQSPLEERDKHIERIFHELRVSTAGSPLWDAHLQYHHGACVHRY